MPHKLKLLLSLNTPLYAPIYIAQHYNIFNAFDDITLRTLTISDYVDTTGSAVFSHDPAIRLLASDPSVLAIVGDPIRSVFCERTIFEELVVCFPLVTRPNFWLARSKASSKATANDIAYIVSHPKGMSAHQMALKWLVEHINPPPENLLSHIIETPRPGMERITYLSASGSYRLNRFGPRHCDCAYITSDYRFVQKAKDVIVHNFTTTEDKSILSAIISTLSKRQLHNMRLLTLAKAIAAAVKLLRQDTYQCASDLTRDEISRSPFASITSGKTKNKKKDALDDFFENAVSEEIFFDPSDDIQSLQLATTQRAVSYYTSVEHAVEVDSFKQNITDWKSAGVFQRGQPA